MNSFNNKKRLKFIITLGTGTFGSSKSNQITLEGYRATADIEKAGGVQLSTLKGKIYGVSQSDMNSCVTLQWRPRNIIQNTVEVYAIDGDQESIVFKGMIINAWPDFYSMPDVFLNIFAQSAYAGQIQAVPPISFKGAIEVSTVMSKIAKSMELTLENNDVRSKVTDIYLANTSMEQVRELARMAGIDFYIDIDTLAITPPNAPRQYSIVPEISKESGLIGYPTFDGIGVSLRCLFNPEI